MTKVVECLWISRKHLIQLYIQESNLNYLILGLVQAPIMLSKVCKSCIRHQDKVTEFFPLNVGVKQGDNLSRNLFKRHISG